MRIFLIDGANQGFYTRCYWANELIDNVNIPKLIDICTGEAVHRWPHVFGSGWRPGCYPGSSHDSVQESQDSERKYNNEQEPEQEQPLPCVWKNQLFHWPGGGDSRRSQFRPGVCRLVASQYRVDGTHGQPHRKNIEVVTAANEINQNLCGYYLHSNSFRFNCDGLSKWLVWKSVSYVAQAARQLMATLMATWHATWQEVSNESQSILPCRPCGWFENFCLLPPGWFENFHRDTWSAPGIDLCSRPTAHFVICRPGWPRFFFGFRPGFPAFCAHLLRVFL